MSNMPVSFAELPPLGLYIHVPWCVRKCPYCDFNSHALREKPDEQAYVQALISDLESALPEIWGRRCYSVFIGGGTPSLLSPAAYDQLFSALRARLPLSHDCEITLEANPGTVERGKFSEYLACGINRISLGVQSFDNAMLERLGRIHTATEVRRAVEELHAAGMTNFNLDLMFGLPGQSAAAASLDVHAALDCRPAHLSYYQLTIEPNTLFHRQPPPLPPDDEIWETQQQMQVLLQENGFHQYEVSAWASPGNECRHNMNYWLFGDYLGIGAGAHSKITDARAQTVSRSQRCKHPAMYLQKVQTQAQVQQQWQLTAADLRLEFMMNALRLVDGFEKNLFAARAGQSLQLIEGGLLQAQERGLLERGLHDIRPSPKGRAFLNDLLQIFLAPAS